MTLQPPQIKPTVGERAVGRLCPFLKGCKSTWCICSVWGGVVVLQLLSALPKCDESRGLKPLNTHVKELI